MKRVSTRTAMLALLVACTGAHANSLSLVYTGDRPVDDDGTIRAVVGDSLSFDVVFDFSDATIGGAFDTVWDASVLSFAGIETEDVGNPAFGRDPDLIDNERLFGWSVVDFAGITGRIALGNLSFEYLGGTGVLALQQTLGGCDCWPLADDPVVALDVAFGSVTIAPIPIPAAVWFLLSGMFPFAGIAWRQQRA